MKLKDLSFSDLMFFVKEYKEFKEPIGYNPCTKEYFYDSRKAIYYLLIEERNRRFKILEEEINKKPLN